MKKKPILGLDLDDLFFETFSSIIAWHNTAHGTNHKLEDVSSYHLWDLWQIPENEALRRVYEFYHSREHRETPLKHGAKEVVPMFVDTYEEIHIFSARPLGVLGLTRELVGMHFPMLADQVHLTNRYGSGDEVLKSTLCQKYGVTRYADDAVHHHEDVAKVVKDPILFEAPWNRDYAATLPSHQKVRSWQALGIRLL